MQRKQETLDLQWTSHQEDLLAKLSQLGPGVCVLASGDFRTVFRVCEEGNFKKYYREGKADLQIHRFLQAHAPFGIVALSYRWQGRTTEIRAFILSGAFCAGDLLVTYQPIPAEVLKRVTTAVSMSESPEVVFLSEPGEGVSPWWNCLSDQEMQ
jgi:hypothetical protein